MAEKGVGRCVKGKCMISQSSLLCVAFEDMIKGKTFKL